MSDKERALIALRDCGVIRAYTGRKGFVDLVMSGHATATPVAYTKGDLGGKQDYRLTPRGHGALQLAGMA